MSSGIVVEYVKLNDVLVYDFKGQLRVPDGVIAAIFVDRSALDHLCSFALDCQGSVSIESNSHPGSNNKIRWNKLNASLFKSLLVT